MTRQIACLAAATPGSPDLPPILEQCCRLLACLLNAAPSSVLDGYLQSFAALVDCTLIPPPPPQTGALVETSMPRLGEALDILL